MLKIFEVDKIDPAPDDPPPTVHLQLTPKAGTQFAKQFKTIDIWVDTATAMPRRIQTDRHQSDHDAHDRPDRCENQRRTCTDKDFVQPPMPPSSDMVEGPFPQ